MTIASVSGDLPSIERVRHELRRRSLVVSDARRITPHMLRITLAGDDLADFVSASPDDHVKIFIPAGDEPERRDYTPRRYDRDARTLVLDFAVHDAGPATQWALAAKSGDVLELGGPRGSMVIGGVRRWLLVGDETALPAIGRRIEEAGADVAITSIAAVPGPEDEQSFETKARLEAHWVHRPLARATDAAGLIAALDKVALEPGTFAWIAAEASVARAVRHYLVERRGHPLGWLKAHGYWVLGEADAHGAIEG